MVKMPIQALYRSILAPVSALTPAPIAYRLNLVKSDLAYVFDRETRRRVLSSMSEVLGDQLSQRELRAACRDYFRIKGVRRWDEIRLRGDGHALAKLVEVRGLEHLRAALEAGHGALLCSSHFGSFESSYELLAVNGYPVTLLTRWEVDNSIWLHELFGKIFNMRRTFAHKPFINTLDGDFAAAARMALPLRRNEVVCAFLDPQPLPAELPRATTIPFLGRQGRFLIGSVAVAQRLGTPILPMIAHRAPDWVHQTLEILPPVTPGADATETFQRCMAVFEQAIRQRPGAWGYWMLTDDMREMGLLSAPAEPVAVREQEQEGAVAVGQLG